MVKTDVLWALESFTAADGYRWGYRKYRCAVTAPDSVRARVVCLHGIQSHAGWYEYSCTTLSRAGYEVFFLDRRGSGVNEEERGDAPSFGRLVDDLAEFIAQFQLDRHNVKRIPLILLGISWGGKPAAALEVRNPGLIDGLALLCPGFCPRVRPSLIDRLRIALSRLVHPRRYFAIPLNDPELFTESPKWRDFIRGDLLSLRQATARLLVESVRLDYYLRRHSRRIEVPVLLMLAGRDKIIDNGRTRQLVERFAARDKKIVEYPDAAHTLEFEPDPDRFLGDLEAWIDHIVARSIDP